MQDHQEGGGPDTTLSAGRTLIKKHDLAYRAMLVDIWPVTAPAQFSALKDAGQNLTAP